MKKQILFAFLICTCANFIFGQSANLKKHVIYPSFVRLPIKPVVEDANRTYSIVSSNSESLTSAFPQNYFESKININGFTKLERDAYLTINSTLLDVNITSTDIERRTKTEKDKDGNEKSYTEYRGIVNYTTDGRVTIKSVDENLNYLLTYKDELKKEDDWTRNYKSAATYVKSMNYRTLRMEYVKSVIDNLNFRVNELYGYVPIKPMRLFWILNSKKHPENPAQNEAWSTIEAAFKGMKAQEPVNGVKESLQPAISYFESIPGKYPGDDKKSKKLRYGAYYNLGHIYLLLDDIENAKIYGNKIIENDYDKGDGKRLIKRADQLAELFDKNQVNTRHFEIITEDKTGFNAVEANQVADNNQEDEEEFDAANHPDYSLSYVMMQSGDTLAGYVNMTKLTRLYNKLSVFVKDFEGKTVPRTIAASEVDMVVFGNGEKLYTIPFKEAAEAVTLNKANTGHKFVKRLYSSKYFKLYQFRNNELVIMQKGSKAGESTLSTKWALGFRKQLGAMLGETCPDLGERVKEKEFRNNSEDLIAFMKAYKECMDE